ncbi:MAG TPA: hypothetical protein VFU23_01180 [Gemmatimonadales bacterium]|nr:hypothetical protein [Gemmatimonadales bacterium]
MRTVVWVLCLVSAACGDTRHLISLSGDLNREYRDTRVGVGLTDGLILTVTLADSPLALASCDRQAGLAVRVAAFVHDHYAGFDSLQVINVAFTTRAARDSAAGSLPRLPFRFAPAAIRAGGGTSDSAHAADTCRAWDELNGIPTRPTGAP